METTNIVERVKGKTPRFFVRLRNIGLILAAVSTGILAAPIALPAAIVTAAGYLATASGVLAAVSQLPIESE